MKNRKKVFYLIIGVGLGLDLIIAIQSLISLSESYPIISKHCPEILSILFVVLHIEYLSVYYEKTTRTFQ